MGGKPSQEGYCNSNIPLVEGVLLHIQRPSPAKRRPVNMWGHAFYWGNIHVVSWVPPHIHRPPQVPPYGPHPFPCSSIHWTTVFCIGGVGRFFVYFFHCSKLYTLPFYYQGNTISKTVSLSSLAHLMKNMKNGQNMFFDSSKEAF